MTTREKTASFVTETGTARAPGGLGARDVNTGANSYQVAQGSGARTKADAERDYESITERTARIEHKVVVAQLLLERLSPLDARARLLASAVLRRDEVL